MIGRDVADAIATGLDRVHFYPRKLGQDVWDVLEPRPVELDVLARGEVPVASVILPADVREGPQLGRRQEAVRDCDAQHRRVPLNV
jgi:hypothetical protein